MDWCAANVNLYYCCLICTAACASLLPPAGDGELTVDSLLWPFPNAITASCLWYDAGSDEPEGADAYLLGIAWKSWPSSQSEAPEGLQARLTSYVVSMSVPTAKVTSLQERQSAAESAAGILGEEAVSQGLSS